MRLVLHIGTHKTATTSLQQFLVGNRRNLRRARVHFQPKGSRPFDANELAYGIAWRRNLQEAKRFFDETAARSARLRCDTVIVSAESLYAMQAILNDLYAGPMPEDSYWEAEAALLGLLRDAAGAFDSVDVVVFFRPQEEYASSLYNQIIKGSRNYDRSFPDFCRAIRPAFDYARQLRLWRSEARGWNVAAERFVPSLKKILERFASVARLPVLNDLPMAEEPRSNPRLSPEVLEFKRRLNETELDGVTAYVARRVLAELSAEFPGIPDNVVLGSLAERRQLFAAYADGNAALSEGEGWTEPMPPCSGSEPNGLRLSEERWQVLQRRYGELMARPRMRAEVAVRRAYGAMHARWWR